MITAETLKNLPASRLFTVKKLPFSVALLLIFHAVGFWGLVFSAEPETYQNLTPLNLLLTNFLLFLNHKTFNAAFFKFAAITFLAGFLAEVLGVHTGLIFGNYTYGEALGTKLWEVPLLIGLNLGDAGLQHWHNGTELDPKTCVCGNHFSSDHGFY